MAWFLGTQAEAPWEYMRTQNGHGCFYVTVNLHAVKRLRGQNDDWIVGPLTKSIPQPALDPSDEISLGQGGSRYCALFAPGC